MSQMPKKKQKHKKRKDDKPSTLQEGKITDWESIMGSGLM